MNNALMATQRFTVEVQPDFIERQAKARPIHALAEIVEWCGRRRRPR